MLLSAHVERFSVPRMREFPPQIVKTVHNEQQEPRGSSHGLKDYLDHIWIYLELFRAIYNQLKLFGAIWCHLKPIGATWIHLELLGAIGSHLKPF